MLALDADINQHIAEALGLGGELRSMGLEADVIKSYLAGNNILFSADEMHKTTPPGRGSRLLTLDEDDWFIKEFTSTANGVRVGGAGVIPDDNIGVRCYHGLNGAVELVVGHFVDREDDVVLIDMTAGADAFSSSLFAKVDALVLVVEPTLKSLSVYDQFYPLAEQYGIPLLVVGNKVEGKEDRLFIEARVDGLVACFGSSEYVRRRERGHADSFDELESKMIRELERLSKYMAKYPRDWEVMERRSHLMHLRSIGYLSNVGPRGHIDDGFALKQSVKTLLG